MDDKTPAEKTYKKELAVGTGVVLAGIILIATVALAIYISTPKVVYQPVKACDLFTIGEAKELLGSKTLNSGAQAPVVSENTATSKCGYTDGNADMGKAIVAAVVVRSGVNDDGVAQNKTEFASGKPSKNAEAVNNLGDSAYFNEDLGQLNILDGKKWIVISYGPGAAPEANTLDDTVKLAHKVLH